MPCFMWKCVPTAMVFWIFPRSLGVICYDRDEFSVKVTKITLRIDVSYELTAYLSVFNLFLIQRIMAILSKVCKPDNFEPHNFLKLSFTRVILETEGSVQKIKSSTFSLQ